MTNGGKWPIYVPFSQLKGTTILRVNGFSTASEEIIFTASDGVRFKMWHSQECCESVYIEDIVGDVDDILHSPILTAEARTEDDPSVECGNWTFYELATIKGSVTIRWYGSSNGYYGTGVDFARMP